MGLYEDSTFLVSLSVPSKLPSNSTSSITCYSSSWKNMTPRRSCCRLALTLYGLPFWGQLVILSSNKMLYFDDWVSSSKNEKHIACMHVLVTSLVSCKEYLLGILGGEILEQWQVCGFFLFLCPFDNFLSVVTYTEGTKFMDVYRKTPRHRSHMDFQNIMRGFPGWEIHAMQIKALCKIHATYDVKKAEAEFSKSKLYAMKKV